MLLKYNTSLVKVTNNLVKFHSNIVYEFNLDRFDLTTLKDGDAQWKYPSWGNRPVTLTKHNDYLEILFTEGSKQGFNLENTFGLYTDINDFFIELSYTGSFPFRSFFGIMPFSFSSPGSSNYFDCFWRYYNNNWQSVYINGTPVNYIFHIKKTISSNIASVDVYKEEQYITSSTFQAFPTWEIITHNVDYNGVSRYGTINLHKLKIYIK